MNSSTGVDHNVGAEEQRSIWCHEGINLFVLLEIDPPSSDTPESLQPCNFIAPLRVAEEEPLHNIISCEAGSDSDEEPSCAKVVLGDLHGDLDNNMMRTGDRRFVAGVAPPVVEGQRLLQWHNNPDVQSREYDRTNPGDQEGFAKQFKYGFPADKTFRECDCISARQNTDEGECERLEWDQQQRSTREGKSLVCSENRTWSPQVDDDYWVPMDMDRDLDDQVAPFDGRRTDREETTSPSSSSLSENATVDGMQLEVHADYSRETIMSKSNFRDIESFDADAISAACLLLKLSADECRKDLSALEESHVYNLGFRGTSNERTLASIAKKAHATSLPVTVRDTRSDLQLGAINMKRSPWSHDDRYIPRLARRAKARLREALRVSVFSNRIGFGHSELEKYTDCAFVRTPTKLQYKSTEEVWRA